MISWWSWGRNRAHGDCWTTSIFTLGRKGKLSKCALKGSKHALNFFRVTLPHCYLHTSSSSRKIMRNIPWTALDSQKWQDSLNRKWMRPRNVGAARATLTHEDSEWSRKFEEPWQSRPWCWGGVGQVFLQGRLKGLPSPFNAAGWRCTNPLEILGFPSPTSCKKRKENLTSVFPLMWIWAHWPYSVQVSPCYSGLGWTAYPNRLHVHNITQLRYG